MKCEWMNEKQEEKAKNKNIFLAWSKKHEQNR